MILFLRMIMHIVVSPKGNKRKKILKKRDELEGIYIQLSTQGVYTLCDIICIDHHFPLRFADEIRPVRHFCYVWLRVFPLSRWFDVFSYFFISSFGIVEQSLTYLCIFGGLYSRPSVHSQLSKNKTCKNFAATNRWPFNQVVFCFYIQPCIISILYMCISHP
jgi:hypothetical protein